LSRGVSRQDRAPVGNAEVARRIDRGHLYGGHRVQAEADGLLNGEVNAPFLQVARMEVVGCKSKKT